MTSSFKHNNTSIHPFTLSPTCFAIVSLQNPKNTNTFSMDNQNRFKNRISRMFRGSFGSCRTRDISDVIEKSVAVPQKMDYSLPSKNKPIPSMCKPRCPDPSMSINSIISCKKIPNPNPHFVPVHSGHSCPPVSPASPFLLNQRAKSFKFESNTPSKGSKYSSCKRMNKKRHYAAPLSSSSQSSAYYADKYYMLSSGEEEEEDEYNDESDAFFSSRSTSLTSDSSGSYYRSTRRKGSGSKKKKKRSSNIRRRASKMGVMPVIYDSDDKVKDSFAVVKRSSDPHNDFRTSMVEMIVEKQIFSSTELEKLLQCFLSLNSSHHHKIIVEVFMEIWETLFSHGS